MFLDQFKMLEDTGLYQELDRILVNVIGNPTSIKQFEQLASTYSKIQIANKYPRDFSTDKELIQNINNKPLSASENLTSSFIKQTADEIDDFLCLYFHTKGITAVENHLNGGSAIGLKNYYYWRKFLEWGTIENWRSCVELLEDNKFDVVGVNYQNNPAPHYSGAFWWAKSSYIKTLPNPWENDWWFKLQQSSSDPWFKNASIRFKDEMWVCSNSQGNHGSIMNIQNLVSQNNLSLVTLPRKLYTGE